MKKYYLLIMLALVNLFSSRAQHFLVEAMDGIPSQIVINDFLVDDGDIWVATEAGLYLKTAGQSNYQFQNIDSVLGAGNLDIRLVDRLNGSIWVGSANNGAYYWQSGRWNKLSAADGLPSNQINDFTIDDNNAVWLAFAQGLARFNGTSVSVERPFNDNSNVQMVQFEAGKVYAANDAQEHNLIYDGRVWDTLPLPRQAPNNLAASPDHLAFYDSTAFLSWSQKGAARTSLFHFQNRQWSRLMRNNGLRALIAGYGQPLVVLNDYILRFEKNRGLDTVFQFGPNYFNFSNFIYKRAGAESIYVLARNSDGSPELFTFNLNTAQSFAELDINALRAGFSPADFFKQTNYIEIQQWSLPGRWARFGPAANQPKALIFASAFWLKAEVLGQQKVSANTYGSFTRDWHSGPVSDHYDIDYLKKYDRVWKVSKADIDAHIANYNNQGYTTPLSIAKWPAHGDPAKGESYNLAPFVDANGNGYYDPRAGDYPRIKGDQAIYLMMNDQRGLHSETQSSPLKAEVHCLAYAYQTADTALNNAIFINYRVFNRGNEPWREARFGLWTDFDLGNAFDDLVGCDSAANVVYVYNADNDDEGPSGFGPNPPALAIGFLPNPFYGSINFANSGLRNPPAAITNPDSPAEYAGYLEQQWKDGSSLIYENPGDGYAPNPGNSRLTRFQYNDQRGWTQSINNLYDNRNLSTVALPIMYPGQGFCFESAYVQARDNDPSIFSAVTLAKSRMAEISAFYDQQNDRCLENIVSVEESNSPAAAIEIYPNPAEEILHLQISESLEILDLEVLNLMGQRVKHSHVGTTLNLAGLAPGVYLLNIETSEGLKSIRFVKK